jgi:hypothetical protein
MIDEIGYQDRVLKLPSQNTLTVEVNDTLAKMKRGLAEHPFAWIVPSTKLALLLELVEKSKEPKRNSIGNSYFQIVRNYIGIFALSKLLRWF